MINRILIFLLSIFFKHEKKPILLKMLRAKTISLKEILPKINHYQLSFYTGYQVYIDTPVKTEELIEFFSSEAEEIYQLSEFVESFNEEFMLEVDNLWRDILLEKKIEISLLNEEDFTTFFDLHLNSKNMLARKMNFMMSSKLESLDAEITEVGFIKSMLSKDDKDLDNIEWN